MSKKYLVVRTFPSRTRIVRGQMIEEQNWRNFSQLVRTGYLQEIVNDAAAEVSPLPAVNETDSVIKQIIPDEIATFVSQNENDAVIDSNTQIEESVIDPVMPIEEKAEIESKDTETASAEDLLKIVEPAALKTAKTSKTKKR